MTRSAEERLERLLCAEHCRFFKPWHEESRRCAAHALLLHVVRTEPAEIEGMEKLRGARAAVPLRSDALLLRTVCTRCEYYPYDCRYRHPERSAGAGPCGGIVVVDLLLDRGHLSAEDLYNATWSREAQAS